MRGRWGVVKMAGSPCLTKWYGACVKVDSDAAPVRAKVSGALTAIAVGVKGEQTLGILQEQLQCELRSVDGLHVGVRERQESW